MTLTSDLLAGLAALHPIEARTVAAGRASGLVIVDVVNGFCTPGAGALAPAQPDPRIAAMVAAVDALARRYAAEGRPIYVVRDEHDPDRPEPPYPPHCIRGSGEEELVPALGWLSGYRGAEIHAKDCINLIVGSTRATGQVGFYDWIRQHSLQSVVFTGICTDICLVDPVVTLLSARNHAAPGRAVPGERDDPALARPLLPSLRDVVVYEPGCATYHLPRETAAALGLPARAVHDGPIAHHTGLWLMQSRGAIIADRVEI